MGSTPAIELVVTGRKLKPNGSLNIADYDLTDADVDGKWLKVGDFGTDNPGFRGFTSSTRVNNKINPTSGDYEVFVSRTIPLSDLTNTGGGSAYAAGDVIDIAIARNAADAGADYGTGTSQDNIQANDDFAIYWIQIAYLT